LELTGEKGLSAVTNAITLLQRVSPIDINTEKITAICNRNTTPEPNKSANDIETKSKDILKSYGLLLISTGEEFKEVSIA